MRWPPALQPRHSADAAAPAEAALGALLRAPSPDERTALRKLALARSFAPPAAAADLCQQNGEVAEAGGAPGCALQWYRRGGCDAGLARVFDAAVRRPSPWDAPDPGRAAALLACLSALERLNGPLAAAHYYDALQSNAAAAAASLRDGAPLADVRLLEEAAASGAVPSCWLAQCSLSLGSFVALRSLLQRPDVPRSFWPAAIAAALPVLEGSCSVLDTGDTYMIAARLAELRMHPWKAVEAAGTAAEARLATLQLALARSFARTACMAA